MKTAENWRIENPDLSTQDIDSFILNSKKARKGYWIKTISICLSLVVAAFIMIPFIKEYIFESKVADNNSLTRQLQAVDNEIDSLKTLTINDNNIKILKHKIPYFKNINTLELVDTDFLELNELYDYFALKDAQQFQKIDSLSLYGSDSLLHLKDIEKFENLIKLDIEDIQNLTSIDHIKSLKFLKYLEIRENFNLSNLSGIEGIESLEYLKLESNNGYGHDFFSQPGIENLRNLKALHLRVKLSGFLGIEKLTALQELQILGSIDLFKLPGIEQAKNIRSLTISNNDSLRDLRGIENMKLLKVLSLGYFNTNLKSLQGLEGLLQLHELSTTGGHGFEEIPKSNSVKLLTIKFNSDLKNIGELRNFEQLETLYIEECDSLEQMKVQGLKNLKKLSLRQNLRLAGIEDIGNINSIESLELIGNRNLRSLKGIEDLTFLNSLTLIYNEDLESLDEIGKLTSLKYLKIYNDEDHNYDFIYALKGLEHLFIPSDIHLDLERIRANNPGIQIKGG